MEPRRDELTHDEIWDDSALIDSWNQALEEYKVRHPSTRPNEACNSHISTEFDVLTPHPEIPQHPRKGRLGRRHSRPVGVSVVPVPFSLPHVGQSSGRNRSGELVDPHYRFRTPRRDAKPETADGRQPIEDEDDSVEEGEVDVGAQTDETSANGQGTDAQQVNHPKDGFLPPPWWRNISEDPKKLGGVVVLSDAQNAQTQTAFSVLHQVSWLTLVRSFPYQSRVGGGPRAVQDASAGPSNLGPQTLLGSGL